VWNIPLPDVHASSDPAVIARGEYLAMGPSHCIYCHAESEAEAVRALETGERVPLRGGQRFADATLGELYAKNLTPDTETGIGRYSDGQIARMLRYAVKPDGRSTLQSLMPYGDMSDEDLTAIISFLRTQPPVRNVIPPVRLTTIGKVVKSFAPAFQPRRVEGVRAASPPQAPTRERGEYLVRAVGNCGGCHTPYNPLTFAPTGPALSGGNDVAPARLPGVDRTLWFKPPNLTPAEGSAFSKFPESRHVRRARTARRPPLSRVADAVGIDVAPHHRRRRRDLRISAHADARAGTHGRADLPEGKLNWWRGRSQGAGGREQGAGGREQGAGAIDSCKLELR
jgi:mono/diheme cytochrome c family protein